MSVSFNEIYLKNCNCLNSRMKNKPRLENVDVFSALLQRKKNDNDRNIGPSFYDTTTYTIKCILKDNY